MQMPKEYYATEIQILDDEFPETCECLDIQ